MIIKLIAAKARPGDAERYARQLRRYIAGGDRRELAPDAAGRDYGLTLSAYMAGDEEEAKPERVLCRGARAGGQPCSWDEGAAEVDQCLARRSRKVKKPVRHIVLSCRAGERLDEPACAAAVATLAEELDCEEAALLWAAHGDTDHLHLHVMMVTVDPRTGGALPFGAGPDGRAGYKEAMQRALTRIEHVQRLQPEAGARYEMVGDALMRKPMRAATVTARRAPIRQEVLDWEASSGFMSFTRYVQEVAGPVLDEATSWRDLHRRLAPHGIGVRSAGNGGELYAGDDHVKLSSVDRRHGWNKLKARLGAFEEASDVALATYEPRVLDQTQAERWQWRSDQLRALGDAVEARVAALVAARAAAEERLAAELSSHQADLVGLDGDARLARDLTGAWSRLRTSALSAIRSAFAARIAAVRGLRHAVAEVDDLEQIDVEALGRPDLGIVSAWHVDQGSPSPATLPGFEVERRGDVVCYWLQNRERRGIPALVDDGAIVWVNDRSDRSVEAAIRLAHARFGGAAVFGDADYLRQCARVAGRLGIEIETITPGEAVRRAGERRGQRTVARRRALERQRREGNDPAQWRTWARAYRRAGEGDHLHEEPARRTAPGHHRTAPTMAAEHAARAAPAPVRHATNSGHASRGAFPTAAIDLGR